MYMGDFSMTLLKGTQCVYVLSCSIVSHSLQHHGQESFNLCPWDSPGRNTGVGSQSLLQGIFPIQGSNPGLLHYRRILYRLSHQGSPSTSLYQHSCLFPPTFHNGLHTRHITWLCAFYTEHHASRSSATSTERVCSHPFQ